jgi:hypothetical protein
MGLLPNRMLVLGCIAPASIFLAGCSSPGGDLISTVALPSEQSAAATESGGIDVGAAQLDGGQLDGGRSVGTPDLTPAQRGYLDALLAAGVHPSNELHALSIGAYVCQAHAAGQSDQAVWDSVAPMVRSDVADIQSKDVPNVTYLDVDTTIAHYIGIATQKLC